MCVRARSAGGVAWRGVDRCFGEETRGGEEEKNQIGAARLICSCVLRARDRIEWRGAERSGGAERRGEEKRAEGLRKRVLRSIRERPGDCQVRAKRNSEMRRSFNMEPEDSGTRRSNKTRNRNP